MAQIMFIRVLQKLCRRQIVIEGHDLPEWGLSAPLSLDQPSLGLSVGSQLMRAKLVAALIDRYKPKCIDFFNVVLRVDNFTLVDDYTDLFPIRAGEGLDVPKDRLLVHIRAGDVSTPSHPLYGPLPISYYQYLTDKTGLRPLFIGEIEESAYFDALRRTFPDAEVTGGASVFSDFQTMRRAKHIAIAVSSFSWLASYLSEAETVHVPVAGMIDPRIRPDIDMLPIRDSRYVFHKIGKTAWENRYSVFFPSTNEFGVMPPQMAEKLKKRAVLRTFITSARIHLGFARRLAFR